jgi:hypothetical protein
MALEFIDKFADTFVVDLFSTGCSGFLMSKEAKVSPVEVVGIVSTQLDQIDFPSQAPSLASLCV